MKNLLAVLLILTASTVSAQKVSGFYKGTLFNDTTKLTQQYELAITEYRGKIYGYSYVTFVANDTFYYGIRKITGRLEKDKLIVMDDDFIAHNFPEAPAKGVRRMLVLPLNQQDSVVSLSGRWETNRTKKYYSIPGSVDINRSEDSAGSALFAHLKELDIYPPSYAAEQGETKVASAAEKPAAKQATVKQAAPAPQPKAAETVAAIPYKDRAVKEVRSLETTADSLVLSFYDNGVIDGDSISVFVNGKEIISAARLTATAVRKTVMLQDEDEVVILLVAENLGSIPPNTGLVMIADGTNTHQLHFSADLQNNASIRIKRKKKG